MFIEFTDNAAHIASEDRALDLPIERETSGALKHTSADAVRDALKLFAKGGDRQQAFCLLPARGISIRRISLPANSKEDIERLLPLQIDAQFPLASDELAWGYASLGNAAAPGASGAMNELLVAAAKKESVRQYRDIVTAAGFEPLFAISALTRDGLCSHHPRHYALLEIGSSNSELLTFDERGAATLRVVSLSAESTSPEPVLNALRSNGAVEKLFVSGKAPTIWSERISPNIPAEPLTVAAGHSAAISGLREILRRGNEPLLIQSQRESAHVRRAPAEWRWAAAAIVLALVWLGLRYAEPVVRRARLKAVVADLESRRAKLPNIDREAAFLQFIQTNQPNYLEIVAALAGASQPGMKVDSLSISRRGELALRGQAQGAQGPGTLRSKMLDSGYFANVVIDEQTPNPQNQQQVSFRMTSQVRAETDRKAFLANKPKPDKNATNKTANPTMPTGAPVEMPGPPPGIVMDAPVMMDSPPQPPPTRELPPGVSLSPGVSLPPGVVLRRGGPPQ